MAILVFNNSILLVSVNARGLVNNAIRSKIRTEIRVVISELSYSFPLSDQKFLISIHELFYEKYETHDTLSFFLYVNKLK